MIPRKALKRALTKHCELLLWQGLTQSSFLGHFQGASLRLLNDGTFFPFFWIIFWNKLNWQIMPNIQRISLQITEIILIKDFCYWSYKRRTLFIKIRLFNLRTSVANFTFFIAKCYWISTILPSPGNFSTYPPRLNWTYSFSFPPICRNLCKIDVPLPFLLSGPN